MQASMQLCDRNTLSYRCERLVGVVVLLAGIGVDAIWSLLWSRERRLPNARRGFHLFLLSLQHS